MKLRMYYDIMIKHEQFDPYTFNAILPVKEYKIYYILEYDNDIIFPVTYYGYPTARSIVTDIIKFYNAPIDEDYLKHLENETGESYDGDFIGLPRSELLGDHVYYEGLLPYKDGYLIRLGS